MYFSYIVGLYATGCMSYYVNFTVMMYINRYCRSKINRGAGYGLEIPCVYEFYGPKPYIDKLREVIASLKSSGLV